jgi:hypothetical protein
MRKLVCVLVCFVTAFSLFAFSVSATDYGTPPDYNIIVAETVEVDDIIAAITADEPIVLSGGAVKLPVEAIAAIANADAPVTFLADGFSIVIDPATITDDAVAIDLNIAVEVESDATIAGITGVTAIQIIPPTKGNWGFEVTLAIPVEKFVAAGLDLDNLKAYYIDSNGNTIKEIPVIVVDGNVLVSFNGASQYVITDQVLPITGTTDGNPDTGVTLAFSLMGLAGIAAIAAKKLKK